MEEQRFYYKTTDEKAWFSLKSPDYDEVEGYEPITEEEFNAHLRELESEDK